MESDMLLNSFGDSRHVAVERAIAEFRAGRPVAIRSKAAIILAFPVEGLTEEIITLFQQDQRHPRLIVPGEKVRAAMNWDATAAAVRIAPLTLGTIDAYLDYRKTAWGAEARAYGWN